MRKFNNKSDTNFVLLYWPISIYKQVVTIYMFTNYFGKQIKIKENYHTIHLSAFFLMV